MCPRAISGPIRDLKCDTSAFYVAAITQTFSRARSLPSAAPFSHRERADGRGRGTLVPLLTRSGDVARLWLGRPAIHFRTGTTEPRQMRHQRRGSSQNVARLSAYTVLTGIQTERQDRAGLRAGADGGESLTRPAPGYVGETFRRIHQ